GLEQPVAFAAILVGLAGEADVGVSRQRRRVYAALRSASPRAPSGISATSRDRSLALRLGTATANPRAATRAIRHIRNDSVKPEEVGMPAAPRLLASSVAASCPPKAPPRVRVTAFIPVATPVCSWRTFCTIRLAIAEKERPMPMPSRPAAT